MSPSDCAKSGALAPASAAVETTAANKILRLMIVVGVIGLKSIVREGPKGVKNAPAGPDLAFRQGFNVFPRTSPCRPSSPGRHYLSNLTPRQHPQRLPEEDRKSTRLNSSHGYISYAVFCLKKKNSL